MSSRCLFALLSCLLLAGLSLSGPMAFAQGGGDDTCPSLVETALQILDASCTALGCDEACYGHDRVGADVAQPGEAAFAAPGDRVPLANVQRIATAPLSLDGQEWGLALLSTRAGLPDTLPGQGVLFLLMGDARLESETPADTDAGPMQAFYFTAGLDEPGCAAAPNTLVIQNPTGTEVTLTINGLDIRLGSTVVATQTHMPELADLPQSRNPVLILGLLDGHLSTNVNGAPVDLIRPPMQQGPIPAVAITLNDQGRVDANSQLVPSPVGWASEFGETDGFISPPVTDVCRNMAGLTAFQPGLLQDLGGGTGELHDLPVWLCDSPLRWFGGAVAPQAHVVPPTHSIPVERPGDVRDYNLHAPVTFPGWQQADIAYTPQVSFGVRPVPTYYWRVDEVPKGQQTWTFWGNPLLDGGGGNDTLSGSGGDDTLSGGGGSDTLMQSDGQTFPVGSSFGPGAEFQGQTPALFTYGPPDSGALVYVEGGPDYPWTFSTVVQSVHPIVAVTSSGLTVQDARGRLGYAGGGDLAFTDNLPSLTWSPGPGRDFILDGANITAHYDAETQTADVYLIEGTFRRADDPEAPVFTGPNDGQTTTHITVAPDGAMSEETVPLAEAEAHMPSIFRPSNVNTLSVRILMVNPVAFDGSAQQAWYLMFDLDGDPATGFDGTQRNAMYTGLGVDLLIIAGVQDDGTVGAGGVFADQLANPAAAPQSDLPVTVTLSADGRLLEFQAPLDLIVQKLEDLGIPVVPEAVRWRVAAVNYAAEGEPKDVYPEIEMGGSAPAGAPLRPPEGASVSLAASQTNAGPVRFEDRSTSPDPDNPITGRLWDFGDGTTSTEANPVHAYAYGGEYTVILTITFANGATMDTQLLLTVSGPPAPAGGAPAGGEAAAPTGGDFCVANALQNANLRGGPGTSFAIVGGLSAGEAVQVIGQNAAGDWLQLRRVGNPAWAAAFLLSAPQCPAGFTLPVAE